MKHFDIPEKELLLNKYNRIGSTISSLAREFHTSQPTVRKWLIHYNICRKSHAQASTEANRREHETTLPSREVLVNDYNNMSINELYTKYGIGQLKLYQWFEHYGIPLKSHQQACIDAKTRQYADYVIKKEEFEDYYKQCGSLTALAEYLQRDMNWIRKYRNEYAISLIPPKRSRAEQHLCDWLQSNQISFDINRRDIISPKEIDIFLPDHNIAIEICGTVWHSEWFGQKDRNYHRDKFAKCFQQHIKLITLWDFEVFNEKTKTLILAKIGKSSKVVGARKTIVKKIPYKQATLFEQSYHMMGTKPAKMYYGLFLNEEIVGVMSFAKARYKSDCQWEMIRMCFGKTNVIGGAKKLFRAFLSDTNPQSVVTYSDCRFGVGGVYSSLEFQFSHHTPANYFYFHKTASNHLQSRIQFQKHKLKDKLDFYDETMSESSLMRANNYERIWDCGNYVWKWVR